MRIRHYRISGRRGAHTLLGAVLIMAAAPGAATIVLPVAVAGTGAIVEGAAGLAGGVGAYPAGGSTNHKMPAFVESDARLAQPASPPAVSASVIPGPAIADAELAALLVSGIGLIMAAALVRGRHRRRIGWGTLPARSLFARHPESDWHRG